MTITHLVDSLMRLSSVLGVLDVEVTFLHVHALHANLHSACAQAIWIITAFRVRLALFCDDIELFAHKQPLGSQILHPFDFALYMADHVIGQVLTLGYHCLGDRIMNLQEISNLGVLFYVACENMEILIKLIFLI